MNQPSGHNQPPLSKKEVIKGLLGGCSVVLLPLAIIAVAVLWRAAWYAE